MITLTTLLLCLFESHVGWESTAESEDIVSISHEVTNLSSGDDVPDGPREHTFAFHILKSNNIIWCLDPFNFMHIPISEAMRLYLLFY